MHAHPDTPRLPGKAYKPEAIAADLFSKVFWDSFIPTDAKPGSCVG